MGKIFLNTFGFAHAHIFFLWWWLSAWLIKYMSHRWSVDCFLLLVKKKKFVFIGAFSSYSQSNYALVVVNDIGIRQKREWFDGQAIPKVIRPWSWWTIQGLSRKGNGLVTPVICESQNYVSKLCERLKRNKYIAHIRGIRSAKRLLNFSICDLGFLAWYRSHIEICSPITTKVQEYLIILLLTVLCLNLIQ